MDNFNFMLNLDKYICLLSNYLNKKGNLNKQLYIGYEIDRLHNYMMELLKEVFHYQYLDKEIQYPNLTPKVEEKICQLLELFYQYIQQFNYAHPYYLQNIKTSIEVLKEKRTKQCVYRLYISKRNNK